MWYGRASFCNGTQERKENKDKPDKCVRALRGWGECTRSAYCSTRPSPRRTLLTWSETGKASISARSQSADPIPNLSKSPFPWRKPKKPQPVAPPSVVRFSSRKGKRGGNPHVPLIRGHGALASIAEVPARAFVPVMFPCIRLSDVPLLYPVRDQEEQEKWARFSQPLPGHTAGPLLS